MIKLLDLERYKVADPTPGFGRFTEVDEDHETPTKDVERFKDMHPIGLKGGVGNARQQRSGSNHLKLLNNRDPATKNMCFANSVLQLLKNTSYIHILSNLFPQFQVGRPAKNYKL